MSSNRAEDLDVADKVRIFSFCLRRPRDDGNQFVTFPINAYPATAEGSFQRSPKICTCNACPPGLHFGKLRPQGKHLIATIDADAFRAAVLAQYIHGLGGEHAQLDCNRPPRIAPGSFRRLPVQEGSGA